MRKHMLMRSKTIYTDGQPETCSNTWDKRAAAKAAASRMLKAPKQAAVVIAAGIAALQSLAATEKTAYHLYISATGFNERFSGDISYLNNTVIRHTGKMSSDEIVPGGALGIDIFHPRLYLCVEAHIFNKGKAAQWKTDLLNVVGDNLSCTRKTLIGGALRIGRRYEHTLVYICGGMNKTDISLSCKYNGYQAGTTFTYRTSKKITGWFAGAGMEQKVGERLSVGLEGRFCKYDDVTLIYGTQTIVPPNMMDGHKVRCSPTSFCAGVYVKFRLKGTPS